MEQAYAQALWNMVQDGVSPKQAVTKLESVLRGHGRLALMPRIGKAFARIAERESRKQRVLLSVAREKDAHKAEREVKALLKEMGVGEKDVSVHLDDALIGGWRLEGRGYLHDASYKKHLLSLYNRATS